MVCHISYAHMHIHKLNTCSNTHTYIHPHDLNVLCIVIIQEDRGSKSIICITHCHYTMVYVNYKGELIEVRQIVQAFLSST